jgi:ComF family protein
MVCSRRALREQAPWFFIFAPQISTVMRTFYSGLWQPVYHLFFPRLCEACGDELLGNERFLCIRCWTALPETGFQRQLANPAQLQFFGRVPVQQTACMYYFHTGSRLQQVMHAFKYRGGTELGSELGRRFGHRLAEASWSAGADYLVPVPLSARKQKERGYNQSECLADGMAESLGVPVAPHAVRRVRHTSTQTHKTRQERLLNMRLAFEVAEPAQLEGRHLILVDDVLTTGATLEALALSILSRCRAKISIATLAYAIP